MKKTIKTLGLVFLLGTMLVGCSSKEEKEYQSQNQEISQLEQDNEKNRSVFLFKSEFCSVCQKQAPLWEEIKASEYAETHYFEEISLDDGNSEDFKDFYEITGLPTFLILDENGEQIYKSAGFHDEEELKTILNK